MPPASLADTPRVYTSLQKPLRLSTDIIGSAWTSGCRVKGHPHQLHHVHLAQAMVEREDAHSGEVPVASEVSKTRISIGRLVGEAMS